MKLYYHPNSQPSRTCVAVARRLGLDVELEVVDLFQGAQRGAEYKAINPHGKVPALVVEEGLTIWESAAIMAYLAAVAGDDGLYPAEPKARAAIDRWRCWANTTWNPPLGKLSWEMFKRLLGMGPPDEAVQEVGLAGFRANAAVLDAHLDGRTWVEGDAPTLADFSLAAMLTYWEPAGAPLEEFPHVRAWYGRVEELPEWQATTPPKPA